MNAKATVTKRPKVFWKLAEMTAVAVKALKSLNDNNEKTYIEAIMNAQALLLSPERQRPKITLQTQTKIMRELATEAIKKEVADKIAEDKQKELAAATPQVEPAEIQEAPIQVDLIQFSIDDMTDHIAARFKAALVEKLRIATEEAFHDVESDVNVRAIENQLAPTVITKKPRIVVCGYRADQGAYISQALKAAFEIQVIPSTDGQNPKRLGEAAANADYVLYNGKFSSHAQQGQVRQHPGLIQFNGGVSACIKRLEELARSGK